MIYFVKIGGSSYMLGLRIKKRREELKLTQQELALKLGYKSRSSINKIEIGENDIPFSKLSEFAKSLNTSELYLLGIGQSQNYYFKKVIRKVLESRNLKVSDYDELRSRGIDLHYIDNIELEYLLRNPELMILLCEKLGIDFKEFTNFLSLYNAFGEEGLTYYENEDRFLKVYNKMIGLDNAKTNELNNQDLKNTNNDISKMNDMLTNIDKFFELFSELNRNGIFEDLNKLNSEDRSMVYSLIKRLEEKNKENAGV